MNFLAGIGKKKEESDREKKIKEFRQAFPNVRRPYNDDGVLEILMQISNVYSTLRIFITGDFPAAKPVFQVVGPLVHPWLDQHKRVIGCPKLNSWTRQSSLAEVAKECIGGLQAGMNSTYSTPFQEATVTSSNNGSSRPPSTGYPGSYGNGTTGTDFAVSSEISMQQQTPQPHTQPLYTSSGLQPGQAYQFNQGNGYNSPPTPPVYSYPNKPNKPSNGPGHNPQQQQQQQYQQQMYQQQSNSGKAFVLESEITYLPQAGGSSSSSGSSSLKHPGTGTIALSAQNGGSNVSNNSNNGEMSPGLKTSIPKIQDKFPELEKLSIEQLERLLKDEISFKAHVQSIASASPMLSLRDQMRESNAALMQENLKQEVPLTSLFTEVSDLQCQLASAVAKYQELYSQTMAKVNPSREEVLLSAQKYRDALEEESDIISKEFRNGQIDLHKFSEDFLKKRTEYHAICCKLHLLG